jgi:crossover junction endodeoxyribonuclease RusA
LIGTQKGLSIEFFAAGQPAQQGSKRSVGNGRFVEVNPNLHSWRSVVAAACPLEAPLTLPVSLDIEFRYNRPRAHYGSRKGQSYLKEAAPAFKGSAPDADKLARAVLDALTGIAYVDDALVVHLSVLKVYTEGTAGAHITIAPIQC